MRSKDAAPRKVVAVTGAAWMWSAAIFLVACALYVKTAAGNFLFDDNSEFIASAFRLGITHPPGYPLFSLAGKPFALLPVDSVFFAVNLYPAFAGACGVALIYILVWRMTGLWSAAASASAIAAVAKTFWMQTGQAEVYAMNFFFLFLVLNLTLSLAQAGKGRREKYRIVLALVLVGALAVINHYSITLMIPVCAIIFFAVYKSEPAAAIRIVAPMLFAAGVALSAYSYLPVRSAAAPTIMWQDQTTVKGFLKHAEGVDRRTTVPSVPIKEKVKFLHHYAELLYGQWTPWILIFVIIGIVGAVFIRWPASGWLALQWMFFLAGFVFLLNYLFGPRSAFVVSVFHISSLALLAVFGGLGIGAIELVLKKFSLPWQPVFAILIGLVGWSAVINLEYTDNSHDALADNFGKNLLRNVMRDGIIFSRLETESFPISSMRAVAGMRSDILLFGNQGDDASIITGESGSGEIQSEYQDVTGLESVVFQKEIHRRPVYYTFLRRLANQPGVSLYPVGLMYQVNPYMVKLSRSNPWERVDMSGIALDYDGYDYIEKNVIGKYFLRQAERLLNERKGEQAKLALERILAFNPESRFLRMEVAGLYMSLGQLELAKEQYEQALQVNSENVELSIDTMSIYNNLSYIYGRQGDQAKALDMIETAVRLAPDVPVFLVNLGQTYWHMDRCDDAIKTLEKAVANGAGTASVLNILGICYERAENYQKADEAYSKAVGMPFPLAEAFRDYGIFNAYIMNNTEKSVDLLTKYMQMKPDADDAPTIRANIGLMNMELGRFDAAIINLEIAARLNEELGDPRRIAILRGALARSYDAMDLPETADAEFQKAVAYSAAYPEVLMDYGSFLYRRGMNDARAVEILKKYIEMNDVASDVITATEMISAIKSGRK